MGFTGITGVRSWENPRNAYLGNSEFENWKISQSAILVQEKTWKNYNSNYESPCSMCTYQIVLNKVMNPVEFEGRSSKRKCWICPNKHHQCRYPMFWGKATPLLLGYHRGVRLCDVLEIHTTHTQPDTYQPTSVTWWDGLQFTIKGWCVIPIISHQYRIRYKYSNHTTS